MKIAIFGGVGFIGTNIARTAMQRGHRVVAFDSLARNGERENFNYHRVSHERVGACAHDKCLISRKTTSVYNISLEEKRSALLCL